MGISLSTVNFAYSSPKKNKPQRYILKDINLKINSQDELITILGESGAGKSTLVQLFNGLLLSREGDVVVFDKKLTNTKKMKETRKRVGLVFQFPEYQLFDETVLKDVTFGPKNFGLKNPEDLARRALNLVGIDETLYERNPFTLSGGQMRKVAIAGILASNPDILVFDEPTVGLDPTSANELLCLLKKLNEEYHKTIVLITHDMNIVGHVSKRILVLKQGEIVFDGDKKRLFGNSCLMEHFSLDYPDTVKMLISIKKKLNIELNELQFSIDDALNELKKVLGNE